MTADQAVDEDTTLFSMELDDQKDNGTKTTPSLASSLYSALKITSIPNPSDKPALDNPPTSSSSKDNASSTTNNFLSRTLRKSPTTANSSTCDKRPLDNASQDTTQSGIETEGRKPSLRELYKLAFNTPAPASPDTNALRTWPTFRFNTLSPAKISTNDEADSSTANAPEQEYQGLCAETEWEDQLIQEGLVYERVARPKWGAFSLPGIFDGPDERDGAAGEDDDGELMMSGALPEGDVRCEICGPGDGHADTEDCAEA